MPLLLRKARAAIVVDEDTELRRPAMVQSWAVVLVAGGRRASGVSEEETGQPHVSERAVHERRAPGTEPRALPGRPVEDALLVSGRSPAIAQPATGHARTTEVAPNKPTTAAYRYVRSRATGEVRALEIDRVREDQFVRRLIGH